VLPTDPIVVLTCFQVKKAGRQSLREVRRRRALFASQSSSDAISIASMDDSTLSSALVFFVGNYFVTFFIIGLIAAGISLINKPKPLRIGEVSEAFLSYHLLFAIGINNLINFVFHVLFGDVAASLSAGKTVRSRQRQDSQVWAWELQVLLRSRRACRFGLRH
jgi:Family of unknown function (DUF6790)